MSSFSNPPSAPYRWLPFAVFAFCAACFLLHPLSPLWTGALSDPDDYMRLNEVINWLKGQGWHDLSQPRLSPGAHTIIHWSRLVDMPIAAFILPLLKPFGMQKAALIASFIVPSLLFILLLLLVPALARPFVGKRANLADALLLFAPSVLFNFTPGRVDHHGWQILIAGFGLLALGRMREQGGWRYAVLAAAAFACGLWIGTEALPWLMIFVFCLACLAGWEGGYALRNGAIFGLALLLATLAVLPLALPSSGFSSRALSWFSSADVIFAALIAGMFVVSWALGKHTPNRVLRLGLLAALGFFAATIFFTFVPDAITGPFADYDTFNSGMGLENIGEAMPLVHALRIDPWHPHTYIAVLSVVLRFLLLPVVVLIVVVFNVRKAAPQRPLWLVQGVFLFAALLLTLFWQLRVIYFMELFSLAPLTWLLAKTWDVVEQRYQKLNHALIKSAVFLALGPLPVLLIPAALGPTPYARDILLFPAAKEKSGCDLKNATAFLAAPNGYGSQTHTILSGANEGPELLFRTPHNVIAGNYNVPGNADVYLFFNAREDEKAESILRKWRADLVLVCRNLPLFYAGMEHPAFGKNLFLKPGADGKLHFVSSIDHPSLIERLAAGKPPPWLKPVEIPNNKDYFLYAFQGKAK
jgi:hypothetical protein